MREKEKRILLEDGRERGEKGERCEGREKESKIEYKQPEEENHQQGVPERHHNGSYNQVSSFFEEKKERYNLQNEGEFHLIGWLDLKISRF